MNKKIYLIWICHSLNLNAFLQKIHIKIHFKMILLINKTRHFHRILDNNGRNIDQKLKGR